MIVRYTESGWSIVLQRSHGLLAGQICARWKRQDQPLRWVETLIATTEHDDVENELDTDDLLNESNGPKNFKTERFNQARCERLLLRAMGKALYVGLLVCRHIVFLYEKDPSAKKYCSELKSREKIWIKQAGTTAGEVSKSYQLLEFCDALSLLICQDQIQPEHRKIEISTGPSGIHYQMWAGEKGQLILSPWPFDEQDFTVSYESRTLAKLAFKDDQEFRQLLLAADVQQHTVRVCRS